MTTSVRTTAAARAALVGLCVVLVAIAWMNRFFQDDAYIVLRYAENLAAGQGLVWNVGERVEGYSSFLHTVLMATPYLLGIDPVAAAHALGLACFVGALVATFAAARWTFGSDRAGLLTVALLGTNYTFSVFATGGLETSLHVLLICVGLWLVARGQARGWTAPALLLLSVVTGLLMLTRPDSAVRPGAHAAGRRPSDTAGHDPGRRDAGRARILSPDALRPVPSGHRGAPGPWRVARGPSGALGPV